MSVWTLAFGPLGWSGRLDARVTLDLHMNNFDRFLDAITMFRMLDSVLLVLVMVSHELVQVQLGEFLDLLVLLLMLVVQVNSASLGLLGLFDLVLEGDSESLVLAVLTIALLLGSAVMLACLSSLCRVFSVRHGLRSPLELLLGSLQPSLRLVSLSLELPDLLEKSQSDAFGLAVLSLAFVSSTFGRFELVANACDLSFAL